jgi:hypothetical protein
MIPLVPEYRDSSPPASPVSTCFRCLYHSDSYPHISSLLCKGTSIHRANKTDTNAQSPPSHTIFSLTHPEQVCEQESSSSSSVVTYTSTQWAWKVPVLFGSPGSTIAMLSNRVSSPTFGSPSTPSFRSARNRPSLQRGGLRPPSSLGIHHADMNQQNPILPGAMEIVLPLYLSFTSSTWPAPRG